jgi:hypothetical protein
MEPVSADSRWLSLSMVHSTDVTFQYAGKALLVSPAVTNGDPAQGYGTGWLDAFFAECSGCTIDAIAIHIYDSATNEAYFKSYIPGVAAKYNKKIWVTEFGGYVFLAVSCLLGGCGCRVLSRLADAVLGRHTCSRQAVRVTLLGYNSCSGVAAAASRIWRFLVPGRPHLVNA